MNGQMYCLRREYQRSHTGLMDQDGKFVVEYSFDVWGNRRNPGNWQLPDSRTSFAISRGYTGQEHLDVFGLINMNGRMYDPQIGRFLNPDIVNQAPDFSQSYNRYSYCLNNPLNLVDLNGYEYDDNYEDWGDDYGDRDDDNVELYHHPILIPRDKEEFDEVRFYEFIDDSEGERDSWGMDSDYEFELDYQMDISTPSPIPWPDWFIQLASHLERLAISSDNNWGNGPLDGHTDGMNYGINGPPINGLNKQAPIPLKIIANVNPLVGLANGIFVLKSWVWDGKGYTMYLEEATAFDKATAIVDIAFFGSGTKFCFAGKELIALFKYMDDYGIAYDFSATIIGEVTK